MRGTFHTCKHRQCIKCYNVLPGRLVWGVHLECLNCFIFSDSAISKCLYTSCKQIGSSL